LSAAREKSFGVEFDVAADALVGLTSNASGCFPAANNASVLAPHLPPFIFTKLLEVAFPLLISPGSKIKKEEHPQM
jgi:hypothetical protein